VDHHTDQTSHCRLCGRGFRRKQTELCAASRHIELRLTRVKTGVKEMLRRDGVVDRLGENRIYGNVYEAAADKVPAARVVP
jgi:hypothetical protein